MIIPGILAQRRVAGGAPSLWTPLNMANVPQIYLDAQDSVVTDVGGACSAISNLGAMGSAGSFGQTGAVNRPAILPAELNGNRVLRFDGADDVLTGGSPAQLNLFRNVSAAWTFEVYKKRTVDTAATRLVLSTQIGGTNGTRFATMAGTAASGAFNRPAIQARRLDGELLATLANASSPVGSYRMVFNAVSFTSRSGAVQLNGAIPAENPALTVSSGNTSDTQSIAAVSIGATVTTAAAADIDLAAIIVGNVYPAVGDIEKLFGWAAHKYGLTANLPANHPYKTAAPTI